jgi:DNA-binding response OmpR family regulator
MMIKSKSESTVSALLIGDYKQDRPLVHEVFRKLEWKLFEAADRRRALRCLDNNPVHVVLAESDLPHWNWRRVLRDLRKRVHPPQLIVTSRTADDYLWSEVLNIGGFDVLPQPLEQDELERVVASARRHYGIPPRRAEQQTVKYAAGVA